MSLRVWLPLNGNLENNGVSNVNVTLVSGNTWAASGKIGNKSLTLTKLQTILPTSSCMSGAKQMSYCYWVKVNTAWEAQWLDGIRWISTNGSSTYTSRQEFYNNCTLIGTWYSGGSIGGKSFTPGVWTHVAATFDYNTGKVVFYINGSQVGTTSNLSTTHYCRGDFYIGDNGVDISENDVRIYDHCLSAAEVKEISQGLVLHYKLDGIMGGINNNLGLNSKTLNISEATTNRYFSKRRAADTLNIRSDGFTECLVSGSNFGGIGIYANQFNFKNGDILTYSCMAYQDGNVSSAPITFYPMMYNSSGTRDTSTKLQVSVQGGAYTSVNSKTIVSNVTTTPTLYYCTFIWNDNVKAIIDNGGKIELSIQAHGGLASGGITKIYAPKLEYGIQYTTWTPSAEEIGINMNKIQDSSGYNNNGTILNNVTISNDAPRYSASTNLTAGNSMINCGRGGMVKDSITVNFWLKSSSWANPISCTEGGGWNFEASGDYFRFPVYISSVGYKYGQSTITRTQICNNQWHMLTGIYDRINQKIQIYVDGVLDNDYATGTSNNIGYNGSNVIWIGAEATGSNTTASNGMAGLFSDFRIYCTALSAADIKQLYEIGAKVDNKQNLHAFEIIEDTTKQHSSITKKGQIIEKEIIENNNTKIYSNGIVETAEIIEF